MANNSVGPANQHVYHVYGLVDPRDGELRWVGVTRIGAEMCLAQHIKKMKRIGQGAQEGSRLYTRWMRSLLNDNTVPQIVLLSEDMTEPSVRVGGNEDHYGELAETAVPLVFSSEIDALAALTTWHDTMVDEEHRVLYNDLWSQGELKLNGVRALSAAIKRQKPPAEKKKEKEKEPAKVLHWKSSKPRKSRAKPKLPVPVLESVGESVGAEISESVGPEGGEKHDEEELQIEDVAPIVPAIEEAPIKKLQTKISFIPSAVETDIEPDADPIDEDLQSLLLSASSFDDEDEE